MTDTQWPNGWIDEPLRQDAVDLLFMAAASYDKAALGVVMRLIAEAGPPPVDPIEAMADKLVTQYHISRSTILFMLRRGIELGKAQS